MNIMLRSIVVPMKISGDDLTVKCCQIAPAVIMNVIEAGAGVLLNIVVEYCNDGCCQEVWRNFILHFRPDQFSGNDPFCLMRAAVVGDGTFACTVVMMQCDRIVTAAATLLTQAAGNSGNYLICSAVQAVMSYEGITKAA